MIAIVPIRSGSKSIIDKNIKIINGKPLIYWILYALEKSKVSKIILATDSKKYIEPQKKFADMVVNFFPKNDFETGLSTDVNIGLKITISASIFVEDLIETLNSNEIIWDYNDDLNSQYIILNNSPLNNFKTLAIDTIENLNEVIDINAKWAEGYNGFLQYLCLKIICEKLKDE